MKATASDGATITLSSSASDPKPRGKGTRSVPVANGENTTVSLPTAGTATLYIHVAAEDGYSTNLTGDDPPVVESAINVRRDADTRVKEIKISWGGDKIVLNRTELGLEDGDDDGPPSRTTLSVTVDEGDGGDDVPDDAALVLSAVGMNPDFDLLTWSAGDCK